MERMLPAQQRANLRGGERHECGALRSQPIDHWFGDALSRLGAVVMAGVGALSLALFVPTLALFPLGALSFPALLASARHPALAQALIVLAFWPAALSSLASAGREGLEVGLVCALLGVSVHLAAHRRSKAAEGAAQPTSTDQAFDTQRCSARKQPSHRSSRARVIADQDRRRVLTGLSLDEPARVQPVADGSCEEDLPESARHRGVGWGFEGERSLQSGASNTHSLLEEAIESLPDAFALFDARNRLVLCNKKYRQYFGARGRSGVKPRVKGAQVTEFGAGQAPPASGTCDRGPRADTEPAHRQSGEPRREFNACDGRHFLSSEHRLRGGGIVGVYSDITHRYRAEEALRESEERFRTLVEGSVEGILIHRDGKPLFANHAFARMFGYASTPEVLALESAATLVAPYERRRFGRFLVALQRGVTLPTSHHFDGMSREGAILTLKHMVRLVNWEGSPAIQSTVIDVTEHRRAEEQARQRQAELAHVARINMMGEMATTLAHELNQPLGAVATYTEACRVMLRSRPQATAPLERALAQIAGQAQRASEIVRRVREFVRKTEQGKTRVDLHSLIRDAVTLMAGDAREHGIALELLLTREQPAILADRIQIEQVLLNLLRNGIEAMRPARAGGHRLVVRTACESAQWVVVTVQDNGPGLRSGDEKRIFDPFYTTKSDGMGMGLSISRSIVEEHAGRLWAERNCGLGVTFHVRLPSCGHHS